MDINRYNTDNGILNYSEVLWELLKNQKNIGFNRAGSSHQNGAAYKSIKTVVTMKKNMLMHAALICPEDTFPTDIWTLAMDYAAWIYNRILGLQFGLPAI